MHFNVFKILVEMNNLSDTGPGLCTSASNPLSNLIKVISILWVFSLLIQETKALK